MSQPEWPAYLTIKDLGAYTKRPFRTLEGWKGKGYLPPHIVLTTRVHKWRRSDIDAWFDLKQRGLLDDWLELRGQLGAVDAWAVMLKRLETARAKTAAVVKDLA